MAGKKSGKTDSHAVEVEGLRRKLEGLPARALDGARSTLAYVIEHRLYSLICAVFFLVLALVTSMATAFFLTFALAMLIMGLDSRISVCLFMVCLAFCPLLLAMHRGDKAGAVAAWAFYFLAIGVIVQLVRLSRQRLAAGRSEGAAGIRSRPGGEMAAGGRVEVAGWEMRLDRVVSFLRENLISAIGYMIIATFAANFLNYLFNVTAGRLLGHDLYGEFAALLSIFIIITVPTNSLQAMMAKKIAEFRLTGDEGSTREVTIKCLQICLLSAAVVALAFLVLGWPLAGFLHISSVTPVMVCGLAVAVTILLPVFYGVMQGFQWFIWLGSIFFGYAAGRFVFGWLFIKLGWGVSGGLLGGAISCIIVIAFSALAIRNILFQGRSAYRFRLRDIGRSYLPFIISNSIFFILVSIDTVIVKRKFSSSVAGDYASAAFLGKIILYFPSSVGIVLFPKLVESHVAGQDTRRLLRLGLLVVLAGSLILSTVFIAFPRFTITTLYGEEYVGASSILWIISLAMSSYTLVGMFMYYFLATEEARFLIITLAACAVPGLLAMYLVASTSFQVALVQLVISLLFIVMSIFRIGRIGAAGRGDMVRG